MVHSCAGHKHAPFRQAGSPGRVQGERLGPHVEQNEELHATPGAQEGQEGTRRSGGVGKRTRGKVVGGVEGEERQAAVEESFFSGFGVAESGEESNFRVL